MTNTELVNHLYKNYDKFLGQIVRKAKCIFIAEECISRYATYLLQKPQEDIDHPASYIYTGLVNQFYNYDRTERKYSSGSKADKAISEAVDQSIPVPEVLDTLRLDHRFTEFLKRNVPKLPKKQKLAIENYLTYGIVSGADGNIETQKTHFRLALMKLRDFEYDRGY